jgi:hypothetical protein
MIVRVQGKDYLVEDLIVVTEGPSTKLLQSIMRMGMELWTQSHGDPVVLIAEQLRAAGLAVADIPMPVEEMV